MSIQLTDAEQTAVQRVAVGTGRHYNGFVERRDVEQELYVWLYGHEVKVREWREGQGFKALYKTLKREAYRYCEREKAASSGYHPDDNTGYHWKVLRASLKDALSTEWATVAGINGGPDTGHTDLLLDMRSAIPHLPEHQREVLVLAADNYMVRYDRKSGEAIVNFDYDRMAEWVTTENSAPTPHAMRQRLERALKKLARVLGSYGDSEEDMRAYQKMLWKQVPRYSNANIIKSQVERINRTGWL